MIMAPGVKETFMSLFGYINRYCPCCGNKLYDNKLPTTCKSACCSKECLDEWEIKIVRGIMGKSEESKKDNI